YCSQLVRNANTFSLTGATIAGGGYIVQTNVNIGAAEVAGVDLQGAYKLDLPNFGALVFAINGAYLLKTTTTPTPGAHTYDCAGLFGSTCQTINPKWHHNFRATWATPWDGFSTSLTWRYLDAVKLDSNNSDETLHFSAYTTYNSFNARIPSFSYLDLA